MKTSDCLVVGGGLLGLLSARELIKAGFTVRLIERGSLGAAASWAAGGVLSPLPPWAYPPEVTRLSFVSQAAYPALVEELEGETGIDPEWEQSGLLVLGDLVLQDAKEWCATERQQGKTLNPAEIGELEPMLNRQSESGFWMPTVAQVRPPRLLNALITSLRTRGAQFEENVNALRVLVRGNRTQGVETDTGSFRSDSVVLAAGAWTGLLTDYLPSPKPVVEPLRGQMILFEQGTTRLTRIVLSDGFYLIPRRDGRTLVGSTVERVGFNNEVTISAKALLLEKASGLAPSLGARQIEKQWAGLRPAPARAVPYIGPHPVIQGLYFNTGHFRNGIALAPASACLLAAWVGGSPLNEADVYGFEQEDDPPQ
jgi:glycine oxidase